MSEPQITCYGWPNHGPVLCEIIARSIGTHEETTLHRCPRCRNEYQARTPYSVGGQIPAPNLRSVAGGGDNDGS